MSPEKKILLDDLITKLDDDPASWRYSNERKLRLVHSGGVHLWLIGTLPNVCQPNEINFGFWGGWRLMRAVMRWREVQGSSPAFQHRQRFAALLSAREAELTDRANCRRALAMLRGEALRRAA